MKKACGKLPSGTFQQAFFSCPLSEMLQYCYNLKSVP